MSHPAPGPVCRDQWSEEETDEEEEEEQVSAESGPREDEESEGGLQINVDEVVCRITKRVPRVYIDND